MDYAISRHMTATENDPFDLHAQQEAEAAQADADRLQRQIEVDDLKWLMGHKQGRRYVWRQLEAHGIYRLSYVAGDALQTAFNEGVRSCGLKLIADINIHCPERYAEMVKEQREHGRRSSSDTGDSRRGTR